MSQKLQELRMRKDRLRKKADELHQGIGVTECLIELVRFCKKNQRATPREICGHMMEWHALD